MSAYRALEARFARIADIEGAIAVLHWDHHVMMPQGGAEARAEQLATLEALAHEILIAAETGGLLASAEGSEVRDLDPWQAANLREMRRAFSRGTAVPPDLVAALARAAARAEPLWRRAREADDFAMLRPALEDIVRLTRERAEAKSEGLRLAPYDALLDDYEPGVGMREIDALFEPLAAFLPDFIDDVLARQRPPLPLVGPFAFARQKALGLRLMETLGFDFAHGRLDESAHPFCGGVPDDVRLTARYDEADVDSALMSILHETGHALYNAGLPRAWRRQPVGLPRSMAVHESQSLLVEMQVCRSQAFFGYLAPLLVESFGREDASLGPENLYRRALWVERSLIRVDADEVTYPLHVILRYRLEKALLAGTLAVTDLPEAWNAGMEELLGVRPPSDRMGCLQDTHWPSGAFGYFPCYTLGALLAAQLWQAARAAEPGIVDGIGQGDFRPLLGWLRTNVHEQGSLHETPDLVSRATSRPLELQPFLDHLKARYLA
jgi:carboxypeptidase Taq